MCVEGCGWGSVWDEVRVEMEVLLETHMHALEDRCAGTV